MATRKSRVRPEPVHSRAAINGHPLHPMLIHFPVAALLMLVGTDAAFVWTGDAFWARASLWLAGVGALGGWVSGVAGLIDLVTVRQVRRLITAWIHSIIAVMLLSLASLNWLLRLDDPVESLLPWGLGISLVTAGLISLAGYLGGQLVYEHAVGVDTDQAARKHAQAKSTEAG